MSPDTGDPNLQFEKADFDTPRVPVLSCAACGKTIDEFYFEINGKTFCMECKRKIEAQFKGGSQVKRFLKAFFAGSLAALLGFGIYYGIEKATGYEFGLVAILVGFMVGAAVRWGSNGLGGWPYQLLAMFLTYNAIVLTYIPMAVGELKDDLKTKQANQTAASPSQIQATPSSNDSASLATPGVTPLATDTFLTSAANPTTVDPAATPEAASAANPEPRKDQMDFGKFILGCGALLLLAYALPFLAGFQNILGLVILAIGLYEAWKINKGRRIEINGPYRAGPPKNQPPPMQ